MSGPGRSGSVRYLSRTRALFAAVLCCAVVSAMAVPAVAGQVGKDAALARPAVPAAHPGAPARDTAPDHLTPRGSPEFMPKGIPIPGLWITESADPENFWAAGQAITYTYRVTNTGDTPLTDVGVKDSLPGMSPITCYKTALAPQESTDCTAVYTTTVEDLRLGSVYNEAVACGTAPDGLGGIQSPEPAEAIVPAVPMPSIHIEKAADPDFVDAPGETITFHERITNTGNTDLSNVGVKDDLDGLSPVKCERASLAPGESTECAGDYTTTQADVDNGFVHNVATAFGVSYCAPEGIESQPDEVTVPVLRPGISLRKSAEPMTYSTAGETITYRYHVTNTGDVPLLGIGVNDDMDGLSDVQCADRVLNPGVSTDCAATYVTTREDVERGYLHNVAAAYGTSPGGVPTESAPCEVTIPATPIVPPAPIIQPVPAPPPVLIQPVPPPAPIIQPVPAPPPVIVQPVPPPVVVRPVPPPPPPVAVQPVPPPPVTVQPVVPPPVTVRPKPVEHPRISIRKSVRPKTYSRVGKVLHYSYRVTNTGTVALHDVRVVDKLRGLSAIHCPKGTLGRGESMTCTATRRITRHDLKAKCVWNVAVAQGTPPGSRSPVTSRPAKAIACAHIPVTG
ncbi:hypothetical protein AB0L06_27405 [Spirillospora sp. NPDC052269]